MWRYSAAKYMKLMPRAPTVPAPTVPDTPGTLQGGSRLIRHKESLRQFASFNLHYPALGVHSLMARMDVTQLAIALQLQKSRSLARPSAEVSYMQGT